MVVETKLTMTKKELHEQAIEILKSIELLKRHIEWRETDLNRYEFLPDINKRLNHEIDIKKRAIVRLENRYINTIVELEKLTPIKL